MNTNILIIKLRLKVWWFIFGILQLSLIFIMIITLITSDWISGNYQNQQVHISYQSSYSSIQRDFSGSSFKGSLSICTSGCDQNKPSYYASLSSDWCNSNVKLESQNPSNVESLCNLFTSLTGASAVFIVFEISSIIEILIWFISMLALTYIAKCYYAGCFCSICSCVTHYVAFVIWITLTQASFQTCSTFPGTGAAPEVCARAGPTLALSICVIYPVLITFFLLVSAKVFNIMKEMNENRADRVEAAEIIEIGTVSTARAIVIPPHHDINNSCAPNRLIYAGCDDTQQGSYPQTCYPTPVVPMSGVNVNTELEMLNVPAVLGIIERQKDNLHEEDID